MTTPNTQSEQVPLNTTTEVFRVLINAPIDRVWAELTRTEVILPFFFNAKCDGDELKVGAPVRMRSKDGKYTSVIGEVLEFNPPHRYRHTFAFTNLDDPPCEVSYDLREIDGQTELTLTNINVPAGTKTEKFMNQGGTFITSNLKSILETGKPTMSGRLILLMIGLTAPFTPARCRSENWP